MKHNNLYLERKWDNNVSWGNLQNQLIYKLPSPGKEPFYVATNSKHNKQSHQRSHLLRIGTPRYVHATKALPAQLFQFASAYVFNSVHSVVFLSSFSLKTLLKRKFWLKHAKLRLQLFLSETSFEVVSNENLFVRYFLA